MRFSAHRALTALASACLICRGAFAGVPIDEKISPIASRVIEIPQTEDKNEIVDGLAGRLASAGTKGLGGSARTRGSQNIIGEAEPNNTPATAQLLNGSNLVLEGNSYPVGDQDWFTFAATAGDKIYVATQTAFSATGASQDTTLSIVKADGITLLEKDDDNGTLAGLASSIAGTTIPSTGIYYLRVEGYNTSRPVTPYYLHFRIQSGAPTAETEPNDTTATANALPPNGFMSGTIGVAGDADVFSLTLNAGDTVYAGLDEDPERDNVLWNGRLGIGEFNGQFLLVNDGGQSDPIPSESIFMTVQSAGTYYVYVDTATGQFGPTRTYNLSVSVHPATAACTVYASADVPKAIPDLGNVTSVLTVPAGVNAEDVSVDVTMNHTNMPDVDAVLQSPSGNANGLFVDVGSATFPNVNVTIDDDAGIPIDQTPYLDSVTVQPSRDFRLGWFEYENASGTWTLSLSDDTAGNVGTLTAWDVRICPTPAPPTCAGGAAPNVLFQSDFEANDGGLTHSGTSDEWGWGSPTFAPLDDCNSGVNCWKTNLTSNYSNNATMDLVTPAINLGGATGPILVSWAQKYQMEGVSFDHAWVTVQELGGTNSKKIWEFMDGTMYTTQGTTVIQESSGWGVQTADISSYAGKVVQILFHLDSDVVNNQPYAGFAIDDLTVTACNNPSNYLLGRGLGQPNLNEVRVNTATGAITTVDFQAYATGQYGTNAFHGDIQPTAAPFDPSDEIVTGPGPGAVFAPQVRAFDRIAASIGKVNFFAYGTLKYGVNVSAANIDVDSGGPFDEILTGAGPGVVFGPHLRAWNFDGGSLTAINKVSFFAYGTLKYGVNPAYGQMDADAFDEILTGPGPGVIFGPQVRGWNYDSGSLSTINKINFNAFQVLQYGVNVAGGDVDADGFDEMACAQGPGPGASFPAHFVGFNYDDTSVSSLPGFDITPFASLFGGRVGVGDVNGNGTDDMVCGAGPSPTADSTVKTFEYNGTSLTAGVVIPPAQSFAGFYGVNVDVGNYGY